MKRLYLALAAAGVVLLAGVGLARCSAPAPTVPPAPLPASTPTPKAQAIASSSAAATASQAVRVTIRRPPQSKPAFIAEPLSKDPAPDLHSDYEEIVIEVSQTITAGASSGASASAEAPQVVQERRESAGGAGATHARLGAIVATVPGAIALTYQLADVEIPPWVLGTPLELGLEVEGNVSQVGAGVSVGSKAFIAGGGYLGWAGPGWYVGAGLRF